MDIKTQAIKNLKDFKEVTDSLGIPFMVMEGTLLGAYREGDFIVGDENDIDLGILEQYFAQYDELTKRLLAKGFSNPKKCIVDGELHGGAFIRGANHIDIMRMVRQGDHIINYGLKGKLFYIYDADIFDTYGEINFHGVTYKTPGNIERFLEQRYGDWKTPVPRKLYSWKSTKYSPNVRWTDKQK